MRSWLLILPLLCASLALADEGMEDLKIGQAVFNTCAACHLQTGEGVIGAFPPLRNRLAGLASSPMGREYLLATILQGLSGTILVNGVTYQGYMQAYQNVLQDEQISSLLNYIATQLSDETPIDFLLFTPEEVAEAKLQLKSDTRSSLEKRSQLRLD